MSGRDCGESCKWQLYADMGVRELTTVLREMIDSCRCMHLLHCIGKYGPRKDRPGNQRGCITYRRLIWQHEALL